MPDKIQITVEYEPPIDPPDGRCVLCGKIVPGWDVTFHQKHAPKCPLLCNKCINAAPTLFCRIPYNNGPLMGYLTGIPLLAARSVLYMLVKESG